MGIREPTWVEEMGYGKVDLYVVFLNKAGEKHRVSVSHMGTQHFTVRVLIAKRLSCVH